MIAALAVLLSGCATGISDDDRIISLGPKPVEAADFVRQSRPAEKAYVPVAPPVVENRRPLKSKEELDAAESALAAKAAQNRASASRGRPRSPYDGRIEPGYRPPKPKPVPESTWQDLKANPPVKSIRKTVTPAG